MSRMTIYEKACQMNQFVGLEHMKKAEKKFSNEELKKSDAQGFYKGIFSEDVKQMIIDGKIGSFLHVLTAKEANYLQSLAYKSKLKIPLLIGIDAIHGNALYRVQLSTPHQLLLLQPGMQITHMMLENKLLLK